MAFKGIYVDEISSVERRTVSPPPFISLWTVCHSEEKQATFSLDTPPHITTTTAAYC